MGTVEGYLWSVGLYQELGKISGSGDNDAGMGRLYSRKTGEQKV